MERHPAVYEMIFPMMDTVGPVSYTHLDVYKRQLLARAATPKFKNDSPKKLVFHNSGSIKKTWKHSVSDSGLVTPTKSNFIGPLKPLNNNTSLHDLEEVNSSGSEVEKTPKIDRAESLISSCLLYTSRCV